ncbi:prepilin peptidase [Myxococcota bacterium]|nr:prepilin peptidase [Myxococcota bacterium]
MLLSSSLHYYITVSVAAALMAHATYTDLKRREIDNETVLIGIVAGLILGLLAGGARGIGLSAGGLVLGFGVFFVLSLTGGMEAGDVKLMGAVGALTGWPLILSALLHVVIAGFFLAILWVVIEGNLGRTMKNLWIMIKSWILPRRKRVSLEELETSSLPYGVAIAAGTLWTLAAVKFPAIDLMKILL